MSFVERIFQDARGSLPWLLCAVCWVLQFGVYGYAYYDLDSWLCTDQFAILSQFGLVFTFARGYSKLPFACLFG